MLQLARLEAGLPGGGRGRGTAGAADTRGLCGGVFLRVPKELQGALGGLSSLRPGPVGVRALGEAATLVRTGGHSGAGRGLRAGGDRGTGTSRGEFALGGARRAGGRTQPAAPPGGP